MPIDHHLDLCFMRDKELCAFAKNLAKATEKWDRTDSFHGAYAKGHAYFGMLEAVIRAKEKDIFIGRLEQSGLLGSVFPEVNDRLRVMDKPIKGLRTAKTPEQVVRCLTTLLRDDENGLKAFNQRIILISDRLRKHSSVLGHNAIRSATIR